MIYEMSVHSGTVFFKLAAGSAANLKPELVMDAYLKSIGMEPQPLPTKSTGASCMPIWGRDRRENWCL